MITLTVSKLYKSFGSNTVFEDLTFTNETKSLGIAGPNGSGKSTLLKCLGQLLRPSSGTVTWDINGEQLSNNNLTNILGYGAPYINLYDVLNCRENLQFLSNIRHRSSDSNQIDDWINRVSLNEVAEQPFGNLSTGQQQRLRLAAALFHEPKILMLDEPGSNLDAAGRSLVADIAESFQTPDKMLILASNNPDELQLCEQIFSVEEESLV
ncbi:heme exporter protein A [Fodinibius salinus]|uniref:Heme exporter protein A n=1 Tax=Fodinibius salinus TaxID=860790 RepID=A0A5D3YFW5_9BACT|nr:ABC transporter ATP-binding protein [Fodinibius salinus]TYP92031.1 heme exporter protein A [Fodinibius salinus]